MCPNEMADTYYVRRSMFIMRADNYSIKPLAQYDCTRCKLEMTFFKQLSLALTLSDERELRGTILQPKPLIKLSHITTSYCGDGVCCATQ